MAMTDVALHTPAHVAPALKPQRAGKVAEQTLQVAVLLPLVLAT